MCGIVGIYGRSPVNKNLVREMTNLIGHRGPDHSDVWISSNGQTGLGHARLSIQDLSSAGNQPMEIETGRYTIVFNGEIYNHLKLRDQIQAKSKLINWNGSSDTETLLRYIDAFGIEAALQQSEGMFAFGLWDSKENKLTLARDRYGEKPAYWCISDGQFAFSSELRSIELLPKLDTTLSREAVELFLRQGNVPAPLTIYKDVFKLKPGHFLEYKIGMKSPKIHKYWDPIDVYNKNYLNPLKVNAEQARDLVERELERSVKQQLIADTSLGCFLSGGVDSTLVTYFAQKHQNGRLKTFSIGFEDKNYNEADHARAVSEYLATDHKELIVGEKALLEVIPQLGLIYDEPFADSSQIPTYIVAHLAKKHVNVCLSGDGGDELFCGYNRYTFVHGLWRYLKNVPAPIRRRIADMIVSIPSSKYDALLSPLLSKTYSNIGDKLHKGSRVLSCSNAMDIYYKLTDLTLDCGNMVTTGFQFSDFNSRVHLSNNLSDLDKMVLCDISNYLHNDILVKVDRAAMANSLETRAPFLSPQLLSLAAQLPLEFKISGQNGKLVLKDLLHNKLPKSLTDRPKQGFSVPLAAWLRGPLKVWAEELLFSSDLDRVFLDKLVISKIWSEHQSGARQWHNQLWAVLSLLNWARARGIT